MSATAVACACAAPPAPKPTPVVAGSNTVIPRGSDEIIAGTAAAGSGSGAPDPADALRLPKTATPLDYDLRLEIDPKADEFAGSIKIRVRLDEPADHVTLHESDLQITSSRWDGGDLAIAPGASPGQIVARFGRTVPAGVVTLELAYHRAYAQQWAGVFRQNTLGRWYVYTQGEPAHAREYAPCFDEPRFKTPWRLTLVVPGKQVALANMAPASEAPLPDGRREIAFQPTPPIPSYLLAFAVGPFELVDVGPVGRAKIPARIAALAGRRATVAATAARLPAIVDALERYTDDALPWSKLDVVIVPHLFGAMENPGLITCDSKLCSDKAGAASDEFVAELTHVLAHELAHYWFGDSVTIAWWDDLWLAEALASWLGERTEAQLAPSVTAQLDRAHGLRFALAGDTAHPIALARHVTKDNDDEESAYDTVAYDKGPTQIGAFERWLGADTWRAGVLAYLRAHRGGNATAADFAAAIAQATTRDAADALIAAVSRAGVPIVDATLDCSGAPKLVLHARGALAPVCVRTPDAKAPLCALAAAHTELPLPRCPAWLVSSGYAALVWPDGQRPADPPLAQLSPAEQLALGEDLELGVRRGTFRWHAALAELAALAQAKSAPAAWAGAQLASALDAYIADADRDAWSRWLAARFAAHLDRAHVIDATGADAELADQIAPLVAPHLAPNVVAAATGELTRRLVGKELPSDAVIAAASGDRPVGPMAYTEALAAQQHSGEIDPSALAAFGPGIAPQAVARAADPNGTLLDLVLVAELVLRGPTRSAALAALAPRLGDVIAKFGPIASSHLIDAFAAACDAGSRRTVEQAVTPLVDKFEGGQHRLARVLARVDRCIAARAAAGVLAGELH